MKKIVSLILGLCLIASGVKAMDKENTLYLDLDYGRVVIELLPNEAPNHVARIKELTRQGFYNGLKFHRVIDGFMAQTGDPLGNGMGGSKNTIVGEFKQNGINNELEHTRGVISMARSMLPDSASSQFFIMHKDGNFLDGAYAAFGAVIDGIEVVDRIANVKTGPGDKPVEKVVIKEIVRIR